MHNTFCFISNTGDSRYDKLLECAVNSFKKWHPDIPVYVNTEDYDPSIPVGINRYSRVLEVALKYQFTRVIILGADTVTCSRLDEFLREDNADILCTLDHPQQLAYPSNEFVIDESIPPDANGYYRSKPPETASFITPSVSSSDGEVDHLMVNADVVCFSNLKALDIVIKLGINYYKYIQKLAKDNGVVNSEEFVDERTHYAEQGALNMLIHGHPTLEIPQEFTWGIVDAPHFQSNIIYNARAKGNVVFKIGDDNRECFAKYTNKMYVKNNKLYSRDNKQIKVWHYCDGFGAIPTLSQFEDRINNWITNLFNKQTKKFFNNNCDCGDFFTTKFKI